MTVQILPAAIDDAQSLLALAAVLGYETDLPSLTARLEKLITNPDSCLLVAKDGAEVIGFGHGYVRLLVEVPVAVEIGGLAIAENRQGQGAAKQLLLALEQWTKDRNIDRMVLSSNIMRTGAHGFYEHQGFKKIKQQFAFEKRL